MLNLTPHPKRSARKLALLSKRKVSSDRVACDSSTPTTARWRWRCVTMRDGRVEARAAGEDDSVSSGSLVWIFDFQNGEI